jgi:hypothetical protein
VVKLKWDERQFEFVEMTDFLVAEGRWAEKQLGAALNAMAFVDTAVAQVLITLRRHQIMLTPADFETWTIGQIDALLVEDASSADADQPAEGEDPTATGGEAGTEASTSASSGTDGGSSSSTSGPSIPETSTD